jgi:hypothetical protein
MSEETSEFRLSNLLKGGLVGAFIAFLFFLGKLFLSEDAPPPTWDLATVRRFLDLISWRIFLGLMGAFAIIGFLLNNKYGKALVRLNRLLR